jgi:HD-GYP domain-containing protein (c-di-GMP phosphodiesterase class II)
VPGDEHAERNLDQDLPGLQHLAALVRAEHEHWDGTGYPDGLEGEQIPLASRITLVCDAYHAMISDRPYRGALDTSEARARLAEGAGSQFCPTSARALLELLDSA